MITRAKQGTYHLGRISFIGLVNKENFVDALRDPVSIEVGDFCWTVTDFQLHNKPKHFLYGKLTKYKPHGSIEVVDTRSHAEKIAEIENTKVASSPFIYLPEYSGIAYLRVWNQIEQPTFVRRFVALVKAKHKDFFVDCDIEAVSDLQVFYKRVADLSAIELIQAKVRPPNPLFGPLWASLKDYLKKRNVGEMKIEERAIGKKLESQLKELISKAEKSEVAKEANPPDITDAALLMATDGYGQGKIHGVYDKKKVVISTSDTIKNFKFDSEPDPAALYDITEEVFKEISQKRHMEHDKKDH